MSASYLKQVPYAENHGLVNYYFQKVVTKMGGGLSGSILSLISLRIAICRSKHLIPIFVRTLICIINIFKTYIINSSSQNGGNNSNVTLSFSL